MAQRDPIADMAFKQQLVNQFNAKLGELDRAYGAIRSRACSIGQVADQDDIMHRVSKLAEEAKILALRAKAVR